MKVFIAGISTETNSFAMAPTGQGAWHVSRGPETDGEAAQWQALFKHMAAADGHEVVCGILADAQPDGPTLKAVYEGLRHELLAGLQAAMPVDAVLLPLHGAMVAEGYPDCEGDLIECVRAVVGREVPIGVELDLHCHFTDRMRHTADVIIAFKEYPHTDVVERFQELWKLTLAAAEGLIRPVTAVQDCRMVSFWHTTREPMRSFVLRMQAVEREPGVLSVSFGHGFPYGDVPEAGAKIWVVTDGDEALAAQWAATLAREVWDMRERTRARQSTLDEALSRLQAVQRDNPRAMPVVMADIADNAGGGASGDSTFILRGLLDRGIGNVALGAFWDLGALQICRDAGVGTSLNLRVGGKCGPASGDPVDLRVTVRAVREQHTQTVLGVSTAACGPAVWISTEDGIDIVLISLRQQVFATDLFTGLGIDLAAKAAIVVKSSQHFYAEFAPLASEVLYVETPGLLRTDFENIPYRHRDLNFWPRVDEPWKTC
jgi:microcystin degradation protein MlrC